MAKLADLIEEYLQRLLEVSSRNILELRRSEIAVLFNCAPSQINYVLSTRFSSKRGYIVESRRGEGGYIRITRVTLVEGGDIDYILHEACAKPLREDEAFDIICRLAENLMITDFQAGLMRAAVADDSLNGCGENTDKIRSAIFRNLLREVLRYGGNGEVLK